MSFYSLLQIINENKFDTISDFLLNPAHRDKQFYELVKEFVASGGIEHNGGRYGTVFEHPSWPYVIKLFYEDACYLKFARFAYRNPHPAFPKLYGQPQRIVPFYKRDVSSRTQYVARMEKLFPIPDQELLRTIVDSEFLVYNFFNAKKLGHENQEVERDELVGTYGNRRMETRKVKVFQNAFDIFKKYPQTYKLFEGWYILQTNKVAPNCSPDVHSKNFMQRANGELVLIDPFWEGGPPLGFDLGMKDDFSNDYYYDDEYVEPKLLRGGETRFPRQRNKKRQAPVVIQDLPATPTNQDEIPF